MTATREVGQTVDWEHGHWMQTFTGRAFHPLAPRTEDVSGEDIAHALSMQCRYNGHVQRFYSVAEHCVLLCDWAYYRMPAANGGNRLNRVEAALWALLHDAAEAYCGDMVRPLKLHMPDFCEVDDRLTAVIAERFGLVGSVVPDVVKAIDTRILIDERTALLSTPPADWSLGEVLPLGVKIHGWTPAEAKVEYLARLAALTGEDFQA